MLLGEEGAASQPILLEEMDPLRRHDALLALAQCFVDQSTDDLLSSVHEAICRGGCSAADLLTVIRSAQVAAGASLPDFDEVGDVITPSSDQLLVTFPPILVCS